MVYVYTYVCVYVYVYFYVYRNVSGITCLSLTWNLDLNLAITLPVDVLSLNDIMDLIIVSGHNDDYKFSMMTSSNWNISVLLALCAGNSLVTSEFSSQRPVMRSFYVFFDLCPIKRLSKPSRCPWFERPSRSWCHCNEKVSKFPWFFDDNFEYDFANKMSPYIMT